MPRRIDDNGLVLSLVKLNGRLELRFTPDSTFSAQYTLHGTDIDDTIDMGYARESAAGQPVVSLGLEMFVENAPGFLEVRFEGAIGSTLAFQYDGRTFEDPLTYPNNTTADLNAVLGGPIDAMETTSAQQPLAATLFAEQGYQMTRSATRNAKVQTLPPVTKNVGVQTSRPSRKHAATQTKVPRKISVGVQTTNATEAGSQDNNLFPTFVDLTEQEERISAPKNDTLEQTPAEPGDAQTFTNAVATRLPDIQRATQSVSSKAPSRSCRRLPRVQAYFHRRLPQRRRQGRRGKTARRPRTPRSHMGVLRRLRRRCEAHARSPRLASAM
jgi:hypothetical protein